MNAKLYLDRVQIEKYSEFRNKSEFKRYFQIITEAESVLPEIPIPENPVPVNTGLFEINNPDKNSAVVVTGNSLYTHEIIGTVLSIAEISCFLVSIDTEGYTVDMAVYLEIFRGKKVGEMIESYSVGDKVNHRTLVIPGFAKKFKEDVEEETDWNVIVGPVCAVELPVFLAALRDASKSS
jgi:acetyl-CoA decarbonylase/synthase complex subunit gamma